ncbi:MAG: lipid-A-disaccharide synthase [Candidatus Aminicenantes bacterium]|nr:lipid-A-disaccharide synthase [Candidatus Aminicenantes bacterium]
MDSVLIIAGENSGDRYGAELVCEFKKKYPQIEFFGIGGSQMEQEGVQLLFSVQDLALVGLVEVLSHIPRIKKIFNSILYEVREKKPVAAVLIDSPDFNLRLAKKLKNLSVPVLYYISPTVWIWRMGRLKTIKKFVQKMMLIFPFEEEIYQKHGIPAVFVGHPLVHKVNVSMSREDFFKKHGINPKKPIICVLPGSRDTEIGYHMPVLIEALKKINLKYDVQFILNLANNLNKDLILKYIPLSLENIIILSEDAYAAMAYSDLALSSCGTANLELALLETPFLAFYRLSSLSYNLGIHLMKLKNYSIVNILAGVEVIPELIQKNFTSDKIFKETQDILESRQKQKKMIHEFKRIKALLGDKHAPQNVAIELAKQIGEIEQ